jgi:archaellum component FlaG (FlaF/FlaG flagellin family)
LKAVVSIGILFISFTAVQAARAQTAVTTLTLGSDRIGEIRTAQGITTMIRFSEPVQEIICGDLYDPGTGKGTFVVQRSGATDQPGNEVFIKPVSSKGASNMFVKTNSKVTYSFDLTIVPAAQAHRMVNVTDSAPTPANVSAPTPATDQHNAESEKPAVDLERLKAEAEQQARQKAAEILRNAQQQADRKIAEADAKVAESERLAPQRAERELQRRFMQALMLGLREVKVNNTRSVTKKVVVMVDPRVLVFDEKAFLRYTIQNTGDKEFAFGAVSLEGSDGIETKPLATEINQSKAENVLAPGESLTGVIVFDPKQTHERPRITLFVRGADSAALARLAIQE